MKIWVKIIVLLLISMVSMGKINATHLVGGVIYYEYLGNGNYKLIFEIYKDCSSGVSIGFDGAGSMMSPLYFGVFEDGSNFNIQNPNNLNIIDSIKINSLIVNPCLEPNGSCVIKGRYETTIHLPKNNVGYTIQYQRCCRNDGIVNIQNQPSPNNGDKPGMTIFTYIPPYGSKPNNSAKFKSFPPVFLCKDQPFYFDHSATDSDGDIIKYSLKTPLVGLSSSAPTESNPSRETGEISWSPPYNLNNVIGGVPTMSIDSNSGLLFCNPNSVGRFVVSIMAKEYRNGVVIDSFIRDFQYNVVQCDIPFADAPFIKGTYDPLTRIGEYEISCKDLSVNFINTSVNSTSWLWNFGDPASGSNNTSTTNSPTHVFSAPGEYRVVLKAYLQKGNKLCVDSTIRIVKLFPDLTAAYNSTGQCAGTPINFTNSSTSTFGTITNYQWDIEGTTSFQQNTSHTFSKSGNYPVKLIVTNTKGCKDTLTKNISVFATPNIQAIIPNACFSQELKLDCKTTVDPPSIISLYEWTLPDGTKRNTCQTSYIPTTNGIQNLSFTAYSDKGCVSTKTFQATVFPLPIIKTTDDTILCYYDNLQLNTTGGTTYIWEPSTYLSSATIGNPIASPPYPNPIKYVVKGTDNNGCFNYDSLTIKFHPKTNINAGDDTSVCLNRANTTQYHTSVKLNGVGGPFSRIFWTPPTFLDNPNIRTPIAMPTQNMNYVFHGIDQFNCEVKDTLEVVVLDPAIDIIKLKDTFICQYDTITITPQYQGTTTSYQWNPTFWVSNANAYAPRFFPLDTTVYELTVSNYCYAKKDTITINSNALPNPNLKDKDEICVGQIYQFMVVDTFPKYQWQTTDASMSSLIIAKPTASPKITTWYYLSVTDKYGCKGKDSINLEVNYPPVISVKGIPKFMCQGDSLKLKGLTDIFAFIKWSDANYTYPDTGMDIVVFPNDTMKFYITATSIKNCTNIDSFIINVQKPIYPYAESPVRMCQGTFTNMKASGGLYYLWKPAIYMNDSSIYNPQVYPPSTFNYKVFISNDCFLDSFPVDVYVDTLPTVTIYSDTTIFRQTSANLNAVSNANSFEWFPKEGITNPYNSNITVTPLDSEKYVVMVTDGKGCKGYDTVKVNVINNTVLLIPTAFTPNQDGVNDLFRIVKYLNIKQLNEFSVYDRWGEKVFTTSNINQGWDGMYKGKLCNAAVYVWHIDAIDFANNSIRKSGNVTLLK